MEGGGSWRESVEEEGGDHGDASSNTQVKVERP